MSDSLIAKYLTLLHRTELSERAFSRAIKCLGSIDKIENAPESALKHAGLDSDTICAIKNNSSNNSHEQEVEHCFNWLRQSEIHHLVCFEERLYPTLLREIDFPPPILFVVGNVSSIVAPQIAVVGSRNASQTGKQTAYWLSEELSTLGLCICSGMATGIDAKAHQGAIAAKGTTVAVIGTGINLVYPPQHRNLAVQIQENGAMISEFKLGSPPIPANFPRRNRIISGMSLGVIVVEAALRSGSLITARLAMEQGREVFAIPGTILNPLASGCHKLIREGAKLVDSVESIVEEIQNLLSFQLATIRDENGLGRPRLVTPDHTSALSKDECKILRSIGHGGCYIDSLMTDLNLDAQTVTQILTSLELRGFVERHAGQFRRITTGLQEMPY